MREKTCCFTGHRKLDPTHVSGLALRLEDALRSLIAQGYLYFGCGGALGFDTLAAQTVLHLREEFPHIRLILVLPCRDQTACWKQDDILVYETIKKQADKCVCLAPAYYDGCMQARNRRLVDQSSACICYLSDPNSGTGCTVRYAQEQGLTIIRLYPDDAEV